MESSDISKDEALEVSVDRCEKLTRANFAALLDEYESPLLYYVGKMVGYNSAEAEDIVQESFIRLHKILKEEGCDSVKSIKSWLYRVVHNLAIDLIRKRKRHREHEENIQQEGAAGLDYEQDLLQSMVRREACQKALHELKSLHPEEQQVIMLKTVQDLTLREIGEIMNLSIGKVSYRLNSGLKALADRLKDEGVLE
jgi:RNA polymerase sigma-70 factor, ECF subfamily